MHRAEAPMHLETSPVRNLSFHWISPRQMFWLIVLSWGLLEIHPRCACQWIIGLQCRVCLDICLRE